MIIVNRESMQAVAEIFDENPIFDINKYFAVPTRQWLEACNTASIAGGGLWFDVKTMNELMEKFKNVNFRRN